MAGFPKTMTRWALALYALLVAPVVAIADAPQIIPIQGYLTNPDGAPFDGGVRLDFALFDASTDGSQLYAETHSNVTVNDGHFVTYLGNEGTPIDLSLLRDNGDVWLEITVAGTDVITPRTHLATTPFAGFAQYCGEAANALQADNATVAETVSSVAAAHAEPMSFNIGEGQAIPLDTRAPIPGLEVTFEKKHAGSRLWAIATTNARARYADPNDACTVFLTANGAGYSGDYATGQIFHGNGDDHVGHVETTVQRLLPATDQTGSVTLTVEGLATDGSGNNDLRCYFGHRTTQDLFVMEVQ